MKDVEDTRIDEIGKIILDHRYEKDPRDMNALKYSSYLIAKKILEYMAPIIEKAEKWERYQYEIVINQEYIDESIAKANKWDKLKKNGCHCDMYNYPSCTRCALEGKEADKC